MPKKLILFPFGGNARESLIAIFAANETKKRQWEVIGFVDDDESNHGKECCGVRVLGGRKVLDEIPDALVLAIPGSPATFTKRREVIEGLHLPAARFATIVHPSVDKAPDSEIGYNTLIMSNVVVSCGVTIGNHCIVLPNSVISHDSTIESYSCIGSNVSISGSVCIEEGCYIGSGTKVREKVSIGPRTMLGLGANVICSIAEGVIAAGNPAKVIRKISATE